MILIDEERARRAAKTVGFQWQVPSRFSNTQHGLRRLPTCGQVYMSLLDQGIRFDHRLLEQSFARLGLVKLKP
jgi:hypothetical protein